MLTFGEERFVGDSEAEPSTDNVMGLTRGLISCYQSFAPLADIAVVLPVFTHGKN
jgi:hypothetical protein